MFIKVDPQFSSLWSNNLDVYFQALVLSINMLCLKIQAKQLQTVM